MDAKITGKLQVCGTITGTLSVGKERARLQEKEASPKEEEQVVTADAGYDGLSRVRVGKVPSSYGEISFDGDSLLVK